MKTYTTKKITPPQSTADREALAAKKWREGKFATTQNREIKLDPKR